MKCVNFEFTFTIYQIIWNSDNVVMTQSIMLKRFIQRAFNSTEELPCEMLASIYGSVSAFQGPVNQVMKQRKKETNQIWETIFPPLFAVQLSCIWCNKDLKDLCICTCKNVTFVITKDSNLLECKQLVPLHQCWQTWIKEKVFWKI